ncbi:MAG: hypothetical protein IJM17_02875 [Firmicutes bacterium]|nr:hypothetical protein [Bacillota bacterium]
MQADREVQVESNRKSPLFNLDLQNVYQGSFSMYVDAAAVPGNVDYTNRILSAYSVYLNGSEFYQYLLENGGFSAEQRYLREILEVSTDIDSSTVNVNAVGSSAEEVQTLLDVAKDAMEQKHIVIDRSIADHKLSLLGESLYSGPDSSLAEKQSAADMAIAGIDKTLKERNKELSDLKAQGEPIFEYSNAALVKSALKPVIIGAVAGAGLAFCWFAAKSISSRRFNDDKLPLCGGAPVPIIGTVYRKNSGKTFKGLDRLISRLFGERDDFPSAELSCALAGSGASALAAAAGIDSIALVGDADGETLKALANAMQAASPSCRIEAAGNILEDPAAVNALASFGSVIIAAFEEIDYTERVSRQCCLIKAWKKDLLGTVIVK